MNCPVCSEECSVISSQRMTLEIPVNTTFKESEEKILIHLDCLHSILFFHKDQNAFYGKLKNK